MKKYITYLRVSTTKQGDSGLGLEAQRDSCQREARRLNGEIIKEFIEVESGKKDNRPIFAEASEYAKKKGAVILIAKLDRLSRSVSFLFQLRDQGVDFAVVGMPDLNTLTLGMFAVFAQHEREEISRRTRAALQARKDRGLPVGNPDALTLEAKAKGRELGHKTAKIKALPKAKIIKKLKEKGLNLNDIRYTMFDMGIKTKTGNPVSLSTIHRWIKNDISYEQFTN